MKNKFRKLSAKVSAYTGSAWAFGLAILGVVVWAVTGPYFNFDNTWLITITTITDVIIFLMVFSLQATQNRDSKAIQLKLNELIAADQRANNAFIGLESLTDEELGQLDEEFREMLETLQGKPVMHKLHSKIKEEKSHRNKMENKGHIVSQIVADVSNNLHLK